MVENKRQGIENLLKVDDVAQLIRAKVHSAIANVYPQLKAECQRQSQMRCDKKIKNQ